MQVHKHTCPYCSTKQNKLEFYCQDVESVCPKCGKLTVAKTLINKKDVNSNQKNKNQIKGQK